jgi:hypothetical protein
MDRTVELDERHVTTIDADDRRYNVACQIAFDGIEFVGHLWFRDEAWDDDGVRDHGALPARSADEVLMLAQRLSVSDLLLRFRRAVAERRRYHGLRRTTRDVLDGIKYLHHVATSMRAGRLDVEEAAREIDATEVRLHQLVSQLRAVAGVEP